MESNFGNITLYFFVLLYVRCYEFSIIINSFGLFLYSIDAEGTSGHICQYVNDADSNSCNSVMMLKVVGGIERLVLFAKKDIQPGEEVVYNYGDKEGNLWWRKKVRILICAIYNNNHHHHFDNFKLF